MLVSDDFAVHSNCLSLHIVLCKEGIKSMFGLNMRVPYLLTGVMWCWRLAFRLLSTHMHVTDLCISPCLPRFAVTAGVSAWLQRKSWAAGKCKTRLCSSSSACIIVVQFTAASSTCCKLPS